MDTVDTKQPFIANHQFNIIRKEIGKLADAMLQTADNSIREAVRDRTEAAIRAAFPQHTEEQGERLTAFRQLDGKEEYEAYLSNLSRYVQPFPQIQQTQIRPLFPKNKNLSFPILTADTFRRLTYLSWLDIATTKQYLVYHKEGRLIGIEGSFSPNNKPNVCAICHTTGTSDEVGFFSAECKAPVGATADYYKAVGNYICRDSAKCNSRITDPGYLDKLVQQVGNRWQSL